MSLINFIRESNKIENILREPTEQEINAHELLLDFSEIKIKDLEIFVEEICGKPLRTKKGMNVRIGNHTPIPGGSEVRDQLAILLKEIYNGLITPYEGHQRYETLHPFMDGNGRSGRVLWLWHMHNEYGVDNLEPVYARGFLRTWFKEVDKMHDPDFGMTFDELRRIYYQSLSAVRK